MTVREIGRRWLSRSVGVIRSHRTRRWGLGILIALVIYAGFGFFALPAILRHVLTGTVAKSLNRPVSVGEIKFNPFSLRLDADRLHVADRDGASAFVDIGHFDVEVSWNSLWHLAPVVEEITIERPAITIVRTAPHTFNFSDLIPPPAPAPAHPSKPFRFAVSNIRLSDGNVNFDDRVLAERHSIARMNLNVPFIANLPADVKIYVKPFIAMVVDGSPLRIVGTARPFNTEPESELVLNLRALEISSYLGYAPRKLPIKMPNGALSAFLLIHFVQSLQGPQIRIGGAVRLDQIEVRDAGGAPLVGLRQLQVKLDNVEPLQSYIHLGAIKIDGVDAHLTLNSDGTTNLTQIAASAAASGPVPPPAAADAQITVPPPASNGVPVPSRGVPAGAATVPQASPAPPAMIALATVAASVSATPAMSATPVATASPAASPAASAAAAVTIAPALTEAAPTTSAVPATAPAGKAPLDLRIVSIDLADSAVHLTDNQLPTPVTTALQAITAHVDNFHLGAGPAIPYSFGATLSGGGAIAAKGALDLAGATAATDLALTQIEIPALQGFAQSVLAAKITAGKLNAAASLRAAFAPGKFNLHAEPASASLDGFEIEPLGRGQNPIKWTTIGAKLASADLATRQAVVDQLRSDGISVEVVRDRHGKLNLESLIKRPAGPAIAAPQGRTAVRRLAHGAHPSRTVARRRRAERAVATAESTAGAPQWRYQIGAIALEKTAITLLDETGRRPLRATIAPLDVNLKNVTSDFAKPFGVAVDATVNRRGTLKVTGDAAIMPLKANLRVATRRFDLTPANELIADRMNATIASALLTSNGAVRIAETRHAMRVGYRGDVTLGDVRMLDKLTNDLFTRWRALSFDRIDFALGEGKPRVHVGGIALSEFYARVILNADGHLNVSDIMANPKQAPTSLTRAEPAAAATPAPAPSPAPEAAATPAPIPADIRLGGIVLQSGEVNYTDNFIRPNYRADLTGMTGKIGEFGTNSTAPADVALNAMVNGAAPVAISGSVNPLAPMAFVDIKAKADGIELPDLSAYSAKYTGYPITKGALTVDVHYLLDHQNLSAQNHIVIDQLTFGDKVPQPSVLNLPVRLAVAILKDPQGRIDLNIPVSGSLNDPQFSLGSVIWHALANLVMKAITSPFRLLAAALPGGGGGEGLSYVAFKPGFARLAESDQKKLDQVAAALKQRASLRLEITGDVDPALDTPGLREAKLDYLIRQRKADDMGEEHVDLDTLPMTTGEYDKYLKQVYKAADMPKPRDFLGMAKSLPPEEMKKLLIAHMKVTEADLPKLGHARAAAVRTYLATRIDPARLLVAAPKIGAGKNAEGAPPTRADLALQ